MATKKPTHTFEQDIAAYQATHTVSLQSYEGLYSYLEGLGQMPVRPTHAGGTLPSDDKIADGVTGKMYDVVFSGYDANAKWSLQPKGYWYNGKDQGQTPPTVLGTPGPQPSSTPSRSGQTQTGTAVAPKVTPLKPSQDPAFQEAEGYTSAAYPHGVPKPGDKVTSYNKGRTVIPNDDGKPHDLKQMFPELTPAMIARAKHLGIDTDTPAGMAQALALVQGTGGKAGAAQTWIQFGGTQDEDPLGTLATGPGGDLTTEQKFGLANAAALQQRKKAKFGGRSSTILGGFGAGKPVTQRTVLGGYQAAA